MSNTDGGPRFSAPHVIEYAYWRSVGPVLGRFFGELRERRIVGIRRLDGAVLVPPTEADPESGETLRDFAPVGPSGVVTTWAWVYEPSAKHPLDRPFAWALIRPDGADSALLHAVDAGRESAMSTGMRVRPRWRPETEGSILDIECFEPEESA